VIGEEIHKLALAEKAIMPGVTSPHLASIDRLIAIMRRRGSLLGLDAPQGRLLGAVIEHRNEDQQAMRATLATCDPDGRTRVPPTSPTTNDRSWNRPGDTKESAGLSETRSPAPRLR
jgi:hypothetical protein